MNNLKSLLGPMRLPFLTLPPVCVLLGVAVAVWTQGQVNGWYIALALLGAITSHISVNAFNEYFDFTSGLDAKTHKTPFSGGSGTLQSQPHAARAALLTASAAFALTALIGVYFLAVRGWGLLPIGLLGLVIIYTYTPWITRNPWLCLIAPGLGFGTLWVLGTYFVLSGEYSWPALLVSFVPFFLVNDLLLLNQFPDVEADKSIGRRHFPIVIGRKASSTLYGVFLLLSYLPLVIGAALKLLPVAPAVLGLLCLPIAIRAYRGARHFADDIPQLIPFMGMNVILNLIMPILVAIGLFIA
jgi:1,4-dihydroxy-2-naphthoate octaprenyltransferase